MDTADRADVAIVGAGIIGLAHAVEAVRAGHSVIMIDREARPVGASVRNFGHCCVTAQSGDLHEIAQQSRAGWLRIADAAGLWHSTAGAVVAATNDAALALIEELADNRGRDQVRPLTAEAVRQRLGGGSNSIVGGAWLTEDIRVHPREAAPEIARWLTDQGVHIGWRTAATGVEPGRLHTTRGTIRADRILICAGHDVEHLLPDVAADHRVGRCALSMARVRPLPARSVEPAVLTGTSMLRYDAFAELPAAAGVTAGLRRSHPDLLAIDANLMCTQLPDGTMIIGDSHEIHDTVPPFLDETTTQTLLDAMAGLLQLDSYQVIERWQGIYAKSSVEPLLITDIAPGVTAISVTTGIGMTLAFGLAERTFATVR